MCCWADQAQARFQGASANIRAFLRITKIRHLSKIPVISIVDDDRSVRNATRTGW
jgi:hypothetical protein